MNNFPSEETLNAYVDGELPPSLDAKVAEAIARDPALAARVAALSQVKSALARLAERPPQAIQLPHSRWTRALLAIAASAGLLLAILSGLPNGMFNLGPTYDGWYRLAAQTHEQWAEQPANSGAREVDANRYLASVDRLNLQVHAPDLTSANLRLTYLRFFEAGRDTEPALHLGYTGRRGCHLTLWVTQAPTLLTTDLTEIRDGSTASFRWRVGNVAYALFASGMAEQRLVMIADKVYEATRTRHGFDEETRLALTDVSRTAPPCSA